MILEQPVREKRGWEGMPVRFLVWLNLLPVGIAVGGGWLAPVFARGSSEHLAYLGYAMISLLLSFVVGGIVAIWTHVWVARCFRDESTDAPQHVLWFLATWGLQVVLIFGLGFLGCGGLGYL